MSFCGLLVVIAGLNSVSVQRGYCSCATPASTCPSPASCTTCGAIHFRAAHQPPLPVYCVSSQRLCGSRAPACPSTRGTACSRLCSSFCTSPASTSKQRPSSRCSDTTTTPFHCVAGSSAAYVGRPSPDRERSPNANNSVLSRPTEPAPSAAVGAGGTATRCPDISAATRSACVPALSYSYTHAPGRLCTTAGLAT